MKKLLFTFVVILLFTSMVFSQSKKIWEETLSKNTISVYTNFIQKYPESKYSVRAKQNIDLIERQIIDSLDWESADSINTSTSYNQYYVKHKQSLYAKKAKSKYIELIQKNNLPLTNDEIVLIKAGNNLPLSQVEIGRIIDELQILALPHTLDDLRNYCSLALSSENSMSTCVAKPGTSLFTYCYATKDKVVIMSVTSPMSFVDFLNSENGQPPKDLNPIKLFVMSRPYGNSINTLGFNEIDIYETDATLKLNLIYKSGGWFSSYK